MTRKRIGTSVATMLGFVLVGVSLVGCDDPKADDKSDKGSEEESKDSGAEAETITVGDYSVNVSCSGAEADGQPVIMLLHGGGDDLTAMADLQQTLSEKNRVCSYDRLGAGDSDKPKDQQDYDSIGETLTGVIDEVAGDNQVVLAGHSMGGLIAARYAPDHQDTVAGAVLLDATSPSAVGDLKNRIPEDAEDEAGELREETLAIYAGENPEQLVFTDRQVQSAGDIPVRVIQHGQQYLAEVPEYGEGLEEDWTKGQEAWLALSSNSELSTAKESGHYIYNDEPDVAVKAIEDVTAAAAESTR